MDNKNLFYINLYISLILIYKICLCQEDCYHLCKTCSEDSNSEEDMKCLTCNKEFYSILINTTNCVNENIYKRYYVNKTDNNMSYLYPCPDIEDTNCYECNPFLQTNDIGMCLSCNPGYQFQSSINKCEKCSKEYARIIITDFDNCVNRVYIEDYQYCEKYITYCTDIPADSNFDCPAKAPIFNSLEKICTDTNCPEEGFENGTCIIKIQKYKDRKFFIFWLNETYQNETYIDYPSFNYDKSGYLLVEFSYKYNFRIHELITSSYNKRKLFFLDEEGRGFFDKLNDISEKVIYYNEPFFRFFSVSIAVKITDEKEYSHLLNFEFSQGNLELINIKTGKASHISFNNILIGYRNLIIEESFMFNAQIILLELKENNNYLLAFLEKGQENYDIKSGLTMIKFYFNSTKDEIDINSLSVAYVVHHHFRISDSRICIIEGQNKTLFIEYLDEYYYINLIAIKFEFEVYGNDLTGSFIDGFHTEMEIDLRDYHKLSIIKDEENETILFIFYVNNVNYNCDVYNFINNKFIMISSISFEHHLMATYFFSTDVLVFNENKIIIVSQKLSGKQLLINILNFLGDYNSIFINIFKINIINERMHVFKKFSFIFKYKDILCLHFNNIKGDHGFVFFGYFNSTDPKQIYNLKKDGLNYKIKLNQYLNLQSNIFRYEIKGIKILKLPDINSTGLYFISSNDQGEFIVEENTILNYSANISLYFKYNGNLKKGNYLFKFAGVLEEPTFQKLLNYSDSLATTINKFEEKHILLYNSRRNLNIIGKAALIQINIHDDIKVFCSQEYDESCFKLNNSTCITCGDGKFYDVENANEITQKLVGENYYFDSNKNVYIKCHPRCKKCSAEYNDTNMECDECLNSEKYKLTNDKMCLEENHCENNYFYDNNFDLHCVNLSESCPDNKPFELKASKECIKYCELSEFGNICNPTNNIYSINETYKILLNNINNLNLNKTLLEEKRKYSIYGNNVSFSISTTEIENNLVNYNSSSILLHGCEKVLKEKYLIKDNIPLIILKIETINNHSDYMNAFYEIYNPLNLSEKLNLDECENNFIEIRVPIQMKKYQLDLINAVKDLNYNIFDLNDPFYNDICSVFSYNNTIFSLSERKTLLDLSNENFCMENCNFSNIDTLTLRSICYCNKNNNNSDENSISNTTNKENYFNRLKESINFSKSSNIKIVKCFKAIFNNIFSTINYGFIIMILTNLMNISLLIIYPYKYIKKQLSIFSNTFLNQMKEVYNNSKPDEEYNINKYLQTSENGNKINKNFSFESKGNNILKGGKNNRNIMNINKKNKKIKRIATISTIIENLSNKNSIINSTKYLKSKSFKVFSINQDKDNNFNKKDIEKSKKENNSEYYLIMLIKNISFEKRKEFLTEEELNDLNYKYALLIDDRKSANYYWSLLKKKNRIISIFLNREDYNIISMKISIFIVTFNLSFTVNALFYNDEEINKVNQNNGEYDISNEISRVLYSAIISTILSFLAELFSYTSKDFKKIRECKNYKEAETFMSNLSKKLRIKIILFFIIGIILNILFFYYLTAFCFIYSNIQTHMISDSLISFLLSISYTLLLTLIPPILRKFSLSKNNKFRHFIYILSWLISLV